MSCRTATWCCTASTSDRKSPQKENAAGSNDPAVFVLPCPAEAPFPGGRPRKPLRKTLGSPGRTFRRTAPEGRSEKRRKRKSPRPESRREDVLISTRPVSRVLYLCGNLSWPSVAGTARRRRSLRVRRAGVCSRVSKPALLRTGFTGAAGLPAARCALTAPFHPYLPEGRRYISVALALRSPSAAVSSCPAL